MATPQTSQGVPASVETNWRQLYVTAILACGSEKYGACAIAAKEAINARARSEKEQLSEEDQVAMQNALDVLNVL
jgi:hypothetical protein